MNGLRRTTRQRDKRTKSRSTRATFAMGEGQCAVDGATVGRALYYLRVSFVAGCAAHGSDLPTEIVRASVCRPYIRDETGNYPKVHQTDWVTTCVVCESMGRFLTVAPSPTGVPLVSWVLENRARKHRRAARYFAK